MVSCAECIYETVLNRVITPSKTASNYNLSESDSCLLLIVWPVNSLLGYTESRMVVFYCTVKLTLQFTCTCMRTHECTVHVHTYSAVYIVPHIV